MAAALPPPEFPRASPEQAREIVASLGTFLQNIPYFQWVRVDDETGAVRVGVQRTCAVPWVPPFFFAVLPSDEHVRGINVHKKTYAPVIVTLTTSFYHGKSEREFGCFFSSARATPLRLGFDCDWSGVHLNLSHQNCWELKLSVHVPDRTQRKLLQLTPGLYGIFDRRGRLAALDFCSEWVVVEANIDVHCVYDGTNDTLSVLFDHTEPDSEKKTSDKSVVLLKTGGRLAGVRVADVSHRVFFP